MKYINPEEFMAENNFSQEEIDTVMNLKVSKLLNIYKALDKLSMAIEMYNSNWGSFRSEEHLQEAFDDIEEAKFDTMIEIFLILNK